MPPATHPVKKLLALDTALAQRIEDFRFTARIKTEAEAFRVLLSRGLDQTDAPPEPVAAPPEPIRVHRPKAATGAPARLTFDDRTERLLAEYCRSFAEPIEREAAIRDLIVPFEDSLENALDFYRDSTDRSVRPRAAVIERIVEVALAEFEGKEPPPARP